MAKFNWNRSTYKAVPHEAPPPKERNKWMSENLVNKSRVNIQAMKNRSKKSPVVAKIHWVKDTPASKAAEFLEWKARNAKQ